MSDRPNTAVFVSVALATFNGEKHLACLLDSLVEQTRLPDEVVVSDDGSQDQTLAILQRYKGQLPLYIHQQPRPVGIVANFRHAVSLCRGDVIAFCDQDDVWLPHKVATGLAALERIDGSDPALIFTDLEVVDQQLNRIAPSYWNHRQLHPERETFGSLLYGNFVTGCTAMFNRPMAEEIKRMPDDALMHDFWLACVAYGIGQVRYLTKPSVRYRQHPDNVTLNNAITFNTRWRRLNRFIVDNQYASEYLLPEIRQAELFCRYYNAQLDAARRQQLNAFIQLKRKSPTYRRWRAFLTKFLYWIE
ncbi:glycosyltransferase family 2 protein [Spirosoma taeanense]|uniref:Glycosyltransferase family 2 protein n=1 Tax=Spirosoma taeanense TaxID=2735870 RepID=A0A6M5Y6I9_9BACT|nr:glycosyltransferase family 2 protein [Spirosoma taeanense]QJW88302.1 glycosyltransferase family 2 protein [Spirosoma taeanense]